MKWIEKTLGAAGGTLLVLGPLGTLGALDVGGIDVARAIWQTLLLELQRPVPGGEGKPGFQEIQDHRPEPHHPDDAVPAGEYPCGP